MASITSTSAPAARPQAPALCCSTRRCVRPRQPHHPRGRLATAATQAPSGPGRRKDGGDGSAADPGSGGAARIAEAFVAYDPAALAAEAGVGWEGAGSAAAAASTSAPALLLVDQPADEEAPTGAGKERRVGGVRVCLPLYCCSPQAWGPISNPLLFFSHTVSTLRALLIRLVPALGSPELLHRLGITLAVVAAIRFGQAAPLAGFQASGGGSAAVLGAAAAVAAATGGVGVEAAASGVAGGLTAISPQAQAEMMSGDALAGADPPSTATSLLGLGIGPSINASWLFALIHLAYIPGLLDPPLRRWLNALRAGGRAGEAEHGVVSKVATTFFAAVAGWRTAAALFPFSSLSISNRSSFIFWTAAQLVAGALVTRWLADAVDEHGLGDGVSLLIAVAVVTGYEASLRALASTLLASGWSAARIAAAGGGVLAGSLSLVAAAVWLTQVEVRLPLVVYRRRRAAPLRGAAGGGSPWAVYAAWGAASEAAGVRGEVPPPLEVVAAAAAAAAESTPSSSPPSPGASPVVLGSADASYLPLRLTPSAMGPLLMGSLALHLLPSGIGLVAPRLGASLAAWLARPAVGPLATAFLVVATEAAATASRDGPRAMAEWMAAAEVGVRGVPPGADTEALLVARSRATRLAGAGALAGLSLVAAGFDAGCKAVLGGAPGSAALLLAAGFVASAQRQVAALVAAPRLERALVEERRAVRELYRLSG